MKNSYYQAEVREFGDLECTEDGLGEEYNPLTEVDKYGRVNPF